MSRTLFISTLQGHSMNWCAILPKNYIHSLAHLIMEIDRAFNHYDHKSLNKEIIKL